MTGRKRVASLLVCAAAVSGAASWSMGVVIPYTEDFNDAAEIQTEFFTTNGTGTTNWTLTNNAFEHALTAPGSGKINYAGTGVYGNGMTKPSDFKIQAKFNVSDVSGSSGVARVGLYGLAKTSTDMAEWTANSVYYVGEITVSGGSGAMTIRQGRASNTQLPLASGATVPSFSLNADYTMIFTGDFNAAGDLTLSFTVGNTTLTAPTILATNVITSSAYYGIRDYSDNGRNLRAQYDDVVLTNVVPEPGTVSLAAGVLMLGCARRRRRA